MVEPLAHCRERARASPVRDAPLPPARCASQVAGHRARKGKVDAGDGAGHDTIRSILGHGTPSTWPTGRRRSWPLPAMTVAPAGATRRIGWRSRAASAPERQAPTVRVPLMGTGPPSTPQGWLQAFRRYAAPRRARIYRPIGQEREPNYSGVQSGSLSPLRAAPLEEAGNGGRSVAHIPSAPRVQTHRRHCPRASARSRPLRQLSPAPQRGASPEALPPRAWSLPRQLFPPARMSKRRDVPIRVFMPFLGVRTVGCPA